MERMMEIVRTDKLENGRIRSCYDVDGDLLELCRDIIEVKGFDTEFIGAIVAGDDEYEMMNDYYELERLAKEKEMVHCKFEGSFMDSSIIVIVDFDIMALIIKTDDKNIEETFISNL